MITSSQIKRLRRKLGITQEILADRLQVSRYTVLRWEAGEKHPIPAFEAGLRALTRRPRRLSMGTRGQRRTVTPEALRALRLRRGMTQQRFAHALGVSRFTVARWEAGTHRPLPALAARLRVL